MTRMFCITAFDTAGKFLSDRFVTPPKKNTHLALPLDQAFKLPMEIGREHLGRFAGELGGCRRLVGLTGVWCEDHM